MMSNPRNDTYVMAIATRSRITLRKDVLNLDDDPSDKNIMDKVCRKKGTLISLLIKLQRPFI